MEYKLNDEISLKYIENVKIDAINYYKYNINNLKNKSNSKTLYFNKEINLDEIDKEKLSSYITEKTSSSNEENIFINLDEFMLKNNSSFSGGGETQSNSSGNGNINLLNFEDFDKALGLIRNAKECNLSSLSNALTNFETLGGENKNIDTGIFNISTKINRLGKGDGPVALVDNYISVYDDILSGIIETYATDQKTKAEAGKLELNQSTLDIEGAENAIKNGLIDYTTKILDGDVKPKTLGEYFKEINTIYNNYSTSSVKDMEDVLNAAKLTEDSEALKDMDEEDRKSYIEAKNKQLDGMYESVKDTLNISRDEFDRLLQNDTGKLAELLAEQSRTEVANRLNGVEDIGGVNSFYFEIENLWYSSEAGQQALFEKFKIDSPTKFDDENALAYTEYIKYCMSREHSQDWLREDLRKFSNVVSKIDTTGTFSYLSDKEVTKEELEYIESFMAASGGFLPYGYEKVGDTYKRREYTKQGEDMLYYMDYHCGEDVLKKDEDRIITAFSNQGRLDAYERNYKGAWINSQLTGNYSSETQKQVAIDNAERDYNILNGIIEDETRKQQLIDEGHLSFEQLVTFVNNNNIDLKELSNKEYIDKNKETIIKETGLSEAQLYNFAITGTVTPTGYADIDGTMQGTATLFSSLGITGLQVLSGIDKFFENVGDAAKTAVKSDFILNFGNNENIYLDLSESVELTKEFKEYRDSVWKKYLDSELYKEQYEKFKDSATLDEAVKDYYDKYLFDPLTGQYRGLDGKKYYLYEDISDKEKEAIGQKLLPDLFKGSKFKEWDLNDSSSSNYYLATFKEGIRNGGDFSSFDDLDSTVIKNAKEQIETINEVSVDKTGTWWNENIYNKDWYNTMETFSFVKKDNILGMTANQIGNMAIPVGLSALGTALGMPALGQVLSSTALFTSAFGGAAEEAFLSGASYNEALGYATLSAGTELVIEKVFSGIAGFGEGWMDEVIDFIPNKVIDAADSLIRNNTGKSDVLKGNVLTQTIKSLITGGIGEGIEEVATDLVTPLWQSLTYMNEKSYGDIVGENVSIESLKQTFLVSFLSSMVFGSSEISQKTNSFNKQMQNLTNEVGNIPGFKEQANKILADIIGYDAQYLTTDIITKTIENNAKQIELNPESQTALKELQQKLTDAYQDLTENSVELKTEEGSVKLSKELIMNISDIAGLNQKNILNRKDGVVIDGDKLSFKNPKTQQKFISALYDNAKNVISNQIKLNNETISQLQEALKLTQKDIIRIEDINSAIQTLKELGDRSHFSETFGSVILEIAGKEISIPTSVVHEITSKYNIKDGKIEFTEENMNGKEFASKILSKAMGKLYLKNSASMEEIQNFNEASKKGNIKLLEKASDIIGNKLDTFVVNSTKVDGKDLIKLEVKTNVDGEYRSVNIYVDSSTNPTVYMHNDLLAEKIQEIINKNISKENIYLGEIVYDKKNDELIVEQNEENNSYVESLKTFMMEENLVIHPYEIVDGTNKTTVNIYLDAQTDTNILENNNVKKKVNEIIETKRKQNLDAKDIYIGKIELKDGQPKITTARGQKAFVDSKTENIVTTERTNITGTNLIKVEAYVTINGKTEKVNAYIDSKSNTNLLSKKNAKQKILDIIIEEKTQNKDVRDVYVGEIVNDKKNGNVVVNQNEATLEQFRNTIIASTVINSSTNTSNSGKVVTENTTNKTTVETEKENKKAVTEEIIIDTKNIFNEKNAKNELDKFIKNIEKNIKDFVSKNKDALDFITRLEQLKSQTSIEFNQKIVELSNRINESYNSVIETINKKIESLNENDPQIEKLKTQIDSLTQEREEAIKKFKEYDSSKIDEIFNSVDTTSDVNVNNDSFNFLVINESMKKAKEQMNLFVEKNNNNSQKSISNEQNMVDIIENHGAESDLYDEVVYIKDKNSKFNNNEYRNLIATYMNKTNPDFRKKRSNLLKSKNITRVEDYIQFLRESNMHWFQMESQGFEQTGEHLKIYLSIDNSDLHLFSRLLLEELIDNNTGEYCFKIKAKDDRVRRDSFVLYCNEDNFTQFAEIIQKVIDNNPSIKFNDPNPLAIQYSDKIYCGFDSYTSYTDRMCHAINELKNQGKTTAEIIEGLETFRKNNMPEGLKNILENNTDNQVYAPEGDYISPQQLTYVIDKMIDKYGEEGTTEIIIKYLNTGRAEYIPNYNGERSIITSIDKNILINYINRNYNSQTSNTRGNTYSRLYQLFSTNKRNKGTFGTDQSVIQKVLSEVGVDRAFNMVFGSQIDNAHYLESLSRMKLDTSSFIDALNNNRGNYTARDVYKLIDFINSSDVIQLVKNNYPGMSEVEAIRFLYLVEGYTGSRGICNYAAAVNMIFQKYMGNEMEFERTFGYPMYTLNNEGKKVLNDRMLIVDMYSIINRDKLVKKINGKYEIVETNSEYLNLASGNKQNYGKFKLDYLKEFIDAKGIKLGLKETFYYSSSLRNISWNKDLVLKIKDSLEKGENINVTAAGFDLLDLNGKIARTNIGSHIMTVVGITNDGKLIVDSWGRELLLDLKSTISNLGREYIVNGEKRTRLVAITGYELTDKAIETKKTSLFDKILNPLKSEESLETFDTSKEIDMIDESVSNMNSKDAENITIPSSFEVTSINILTRENITINIDTNTLEELVQDSSKLASKLTGLFNLNLPPTAIKDGVIKYIDFAKENNIEIQIDKNVQKWYEAVKNAKENNHILINEDDVIRKGVEPKTRLIYEFDSVKYGKYFGEIKITELLDMIEGKRNVTLAPQELTTALNELSKYIKENGIKLNENITNKLNQIVNIDNSHVVVNPIEVVNGASPIILNKYIKVNVRNVSTLKLVELISNKYNLVGYINNKFYIDELQHIDIEREVIALFNESPELAIQYNEVLDLIKEAKNNYALFDYINKTYIILPKEINGVNIEEILQFITLSKVELNRRINTLDMEVLNKYKSTIDSIISTVKEKGSQVDVSDLINIKTQIEVPNETRRNVFGILHKAYSSNEEIGGTYGPEQSAIGIKLSKIQLKSSIETLFKTKMTDVEFFKHLGLDSVTQEKFKKILYKNCRKQNGILAKMFGDYVNNEVVYQELQKLADIVKKNIPELNDKQAFMFLYYMEAGEIGTKGICSYADAASIIINKYLGDPIKFEKDFGFPMYTVNSKGDRIYNYEMLIVDMYSNINKETLLTIDDKTGNIIFEPTNKNQTYLGDFDIGLNQEVLNKYFKDKNIELSLNKTFDFNSEKDVMHYEKILSQIAQQLEKGNTVHLGARGFDLVNEQGNNVADDVGGHAMTVLGINSDGNLVVNSWGKIAIFDLKAELAKTGSEYFDKDANGNVVEKDTSMLYIQAFQTIEGTSIFDEVIELTKNSNRGSVQSSIGASEAKNVSIHSTRDSYLEKASSKFTGVNDKEPVNDIQTTIKKQFEDLVQYIENNRGRQEYNDLVFKNKVKQIYKNLLNFRPKSLGGLHSLLSKNIGNENASNLMYKIGRELLPPTHSIKLSDINLDSEHLKEYYINLFEGMLKKGLIEPKKKQKVIQSVEVYSKNGTFDKLLSNITIESDIATLTLEQIKNIKDSIIKILVYNQILSSDIGKLKIIVRNSESPSRFYDKYNSNYSIDSANGVIELWNNNFSEENIVGAFANLLFNKLATPGSTFVTDWAEASKDKKTTLISSYDNLISIRHDFVNSFVSFNKNPRQFLERFSHTKGEDIVHVGKGKVIKELFKQPKGTKRDFSNALLMQDGEKLNLVSPSNIEFNEQFTAEARNFDYLVQEVFNNYSYEDYHLIYGGFTLAKNGTIYGTHSVSNFVKAVINNNINISNFAVHPSFRTTVFEYYMLGNNPKTVFTFSNRQFLKMYHSTFEKYRKAISDNVLGNIGDCQMILLPNGLWIQRWGNINDQSRSFYPVINNVAEGVEQFKHNGKTVLPVPIKINGETKIINVSIDGVITKEILEYGPKLIQTVRRIVNNKDINSININELRFNQTTESFDIIVKKDSVEVVISNTLVMNKETAPYILEYIEAFKEGKILRDESVILTDEDIKKYSKPLVYLNDTYASIPTTTLLDFVKLDVDSMAKVLINKEQYNGYDAEEMLDAIIEVYNYSKNNNINISINPNLEHFIKEYQKVKLEDNNELSNLRRALYNKESIISIPTSIKVPSYRSVSVNILFDILNGKKDISTTYYSEIDIYDATKELLKYFEGKNVTISEKIKRAFDEAKNIDENSTIINFIDVLNGKEKIVLPKTIKGKYGNSNISDVIQYLNGDSSFISTGVIENLKEYINANNLYIPSDMMDKINLLSSLGEDNVLLNEKAYLKGESSPIIVPKNLEGIYTNTSNIHGWITGEEKLYNLRTIEEVIKLTTKFTEYIYSNNIMLDNTTMSKLEVLKNLKEDETIINLEEFFNGSSAIIVKNSINVNGTNIKLSTILDTINLTDNTHLKILSGKNIDGVTRENIFDAIDELYKVRPELRLTTISNYSKIKNIYDNNYIFNERYLFPKTFNDITCELIEEILTNPIRIAKYNGDKRIQIIDAINEYTELIGNEVGKYFAYNERVKMRDNLVSLMSREIPQIDLSKEVYSQLYYMFSNVKDNGGTFGTNQGVIREMLKDLGIKDSVKALFFNETITDDNFLTDLKKLDITKEKLTQALNDLFWNPNKESVVRLTDFIKNNEVIKLVQKNFPGMNGVEAIRFLYLAETKEAGNNGICNYAAATNMIFNKYLGKEALFEADFGYPMYIINEQGKKVLNDRMLLVDMYSTINKGVLVKEVNGKYEIATTNYNYLNLADVGRFEMEYLQRFIDAKGIDLGLKENFYYSSYDGHTLWKEEFILKIKESLEKGEYINISGSGFDLLYKNGDIAVKDCGGHIMTLVGLTPDGKVIVDSWGQELLIDLESTLEHLGEKYDSGYARRLAIASYELTDTNNNIQNNASNQELETFDIPKEIDMIDESTYNLEKDESIEDLEPLIIDDEQVNGSNESSQNAQVKASRPQIQTENIKQLSILDNMKHTLQRINDKFTGFKTSKLNSESYYDRTTKSNNKLFKQKRINKTFRDFANRHLIDLENLISNGLLRNPKISEINSLITDNRVLTSIEDANVSIADILGTRKNVDLDKNFGLLFNEGSSEFQTRDLGLLEYTSDQILNVLSESFKTHPIVISEVNTGKYIIEDNGYHRYSILRLHYLNEYMKVKDNPLLVAELNEKYKVPVKVYKLDTTKTYCTSILKELDTDIKVKTSSVTKKSKIFIDGKKVNMTDAELIEFTKDKINSNRNSTQIINKLLSESEAFREFYNGYLANESNDYGIELNTEETTTNRQIQVNNKTYQLNTIIDIIENRYLEILKGRTIDGINMQNIFTIVNKVFENNPEIKNKYKSDYDNIIDIFKNKYVHENGNLYPKTFNFIKTEDIIEILKNPYKLQRYSKEKRIQITEAINQYIEYARTNNYDLVPKEYKGYLKVSKLMSKDVPNAKLTSEVKSPLLNEFRRNALKGGTFGSKQGVIRILLERNGITNAINYLFNKDATGTKFLEQIKDFTDEDFQDLLDNAVDETGRLEGLYNLYDEYELFELMRNNFEGIEDLEIIKFLYLFESTEAGAKGICNYSVAVNMIFNKYLGNEQQFKRDFGYPMYVIKDGKKILNDMMLLVDMYSIINEKVFTQKIDGVVKVTAINNKNYLSVTNPGGSFNIENLQKFLNKKDIKLDLNQTFAFDSRTDVMWKEEILTNVKYALEKGKTVNLSAQGFDLYRKDGKTIAAKDFEGHAMTVVGLTKDGNLIVDSHGMEMIVNLDLTLENAGKVYIDKNKSIKTRRIGITTYSFDSSVPSSKQNIEIIDVSDSIVNKEFDEGIFDVFSKSTGDIDLFKDILSKNKLDTLTDSQVSSLVDNIKKGKIKPKDYDLTSETIRILIDKVPLKKIFPISNVTAIKSFIDYFGVDTLVEFDRLNNGFLFENKGENLYNLFDFYDLSIPKTNESDKLKALDKLIVDTINSNKKTEYKTYTFNYSKLIGSEFAKMHSELFLDESAPQDLKEAFYNGLVNSGNEYKPEWSKYLEGKSVKGVIHEPLIGYEDVKVVENINALGENSSKYQEGLEVLAKRVGLSIEEVQEILSSKLKDLIETSEFGVRRTLKSLQSVLETGKLKNQFEVNHSSYGVSNTDMRMDMERDLFGIPRNIKYEDRPIYGMLLPQDLSSKYVHKGPGAYYSDGSGVIYIFDKSKIMNNTTLTLGDSIDQAGKICATNLSNPKYFGMFSEILSTIKTKEDLLNFEFTNLYDKTVMEVGNSAYYEFQLHGESSHTLDNLKEIVFLKMPEAKIIKKLEELNISYRVIG